VDWNRVDAEIAHLTPDPVRVQRAVDDGAATGRARLVRRLRIRQLWAVGTVGAVLLAGFAGRSLVGAPSPAPPATTSSQAQTSTDHSAPSTGTGKSEAPPPTTSLPQPSVPGPPSVTARAGTERIKLDVVPPSDNGGAALTEYHAICVSADGGDRREARSDQTLFAVEGLTGGIAYTCTATALNNVGEGPRSAATDPVTPIGRPGPPTDVTARPGTSDGSVIVTFGPPSNTGGLPVVRYSVRCVSTVSTHEGGDSATTSPITVRSLQTDKTYRCAVTATNAVGVGEPSPPVEVSPASG
jgi:titin